MNSQSIVLRAIGEAWHSPQNIREPRRSGWTRILQCRSAHWVLEGFLRFTIVVEAKLVHRRVVDGPGMADIPLLESLVGDGSKAWHVRASRLKLRKRRDDVVIIEIIVKTKVLLVVNAVIDLYRKLIATVRLHRY